MSGPAIAVVGSPAKRWNRSTARAVRAVYALENGPDGKPWNASSTRSSATS